MKSLERAKGRLSEHLKPLERAALTLAMLEDVLLALEAGELETLSPIRLRFSGSLLDLTTARDDQDVLHTEVQDVQGKIINTTVGRVLLNEQLPGGFPYVNGLLKKKGLQQLVQKCYLDFGLERTVDMLDALKHLGFTYATRSGLSIGIDDLIIPANKGQLVENARWPVRPTLSGLAVT